MAGGQKQKAIFAVLAAVTVGIFVGRASVLLSSSRLQASGNAQMVEQPPVVWKDYQVEPLDETEDEMQIDLNTAGEEELCQLPGIGPARAKNIVEYRQRCGPFASIEEVRAVPGIGDRIFETIKPGITVGDTLPGEGNP